jgi:hypothetical protein
MPPCGTALGGGDVEAMAAMEKGNALEAAGDLAGAKEWVDRARALGHNCLEEYVK